MGTRSLQRGFTLIELMIIVGVLGILTALAIPAYNSYIVRSQVAEGLSLAESWRTDVAQYYAENGTWPQLSDLPENNSPSSGRFASSVTVLPGGQVQVTYGNQASGAISGALLVLTPYTDENNDVLWVCGLAPPPASAVISSSAVTPSAATNTLATQYLPANCHT